MVIFQQKPPNWGKNCNFRPIAGFDIDRCWTIKHYNILTAEYRLQHLLIVGD